MSLSGALQRKKIQIKAERVLHDSKQNLIKIRGIYVENEYDENDEVKEELEKVSMIEQSLEKYSAEAYGEEAAEENVSFHSNEKEEAVEKGMTKLNEMEEMPRNVTTSKPDVKISDFPLDVLYNNKMEKVRQVFNNKFACIFPIQMVMMKSETTDVSNKTDDDDR